MDEIKDKILDSKNILMVLPEEPEKNLIFSVFGLALAIESLDKNLCVISNKKHYDKHSFLNIPKSVSEEPTGSGDIFVSINTNDQDIKELRYEKLDDELRIYLSSDKGLKKESVLTKFASSPYDLILVFGADSKNDIYSFYKKHKEIFEDADVVYINQKNYAKLALDMVSDIKVFLSKDIATNILASLLLEHEDLIKSGYDVFNMASHLLKQNADLKNIAVSLFKDSDLRNKEISYSIVKNSLILKEDLVLSRIFGHESERLELSSKEIISGIMETLEMIPEDFGILLLIEPQEKYLSELGFLGVFASKNEAKLNKISNILGKKAEKNYIIFVLEANSLSEAEQKMKKLLLAEF